MPLDPIIAKLRQAAEATEQLAAEYLEAIRPLQEATQALADVPLDERERWTGTFWELVRVVKECGLQDVADELPGHARWEEMRKNDDDAKAIAGRAFALALADAVASDAPPDAYFATLDEHSFIGPGDVESELRGILSHLRVQGRDRAARRFAERYRAILDAAEMTSDRLARKLRATGTPLSDAARRAIGDWLTATDPIPMYSDCAVRVSDPAGLSESAECNPRPFDGWACALRDAHSRDDIARIIEHVRRELDPGSESRYCTAAHAPELLRELWGAMRRVGGTVPPPPALLLSTTDETERVYRVAFLRGQHDVLPHPEAILAAVDTAYQWAAAANDAPADPLPAGGERAEGGKRKRRRGRPADTNPTHDKRLYEAWASGEYRTYDELAREHGTTRREVELALDRHRKRLERAD